MMFAETKPILDPSFVNTDYVKLKKLRKKQNAKRS